MRPEWAANLRGGIRQPLWLIGGVLTVGAILLSFLVVVVRAGESDPVGAATPPAAVRPPVTVVTWNLCADTWEVCPYGGKPLALAHALTDIVRTRRADVVLLQEACRSVLTPAMTALGPGWTSSFQPVYRAWRNRKGVRTKQARCSGDLGEYGLAVLVRRDLGASGTEPTVRLNPLRSPRPVSKRIVEQRLAMCVQIEAARLQVCNAHFSIRDQDPTGELRARQADQLAQELWFGERLGYATLVGGDLNATPDGQVQPSGRSVLRPLYQRATECDDGDRPTYGAVKLDYLFAGRGFSRVGCEVIDRPESDHRVLVGRFRPESMAMQPAAPKAAPKSDAAKPAAQESDAANRDAAKPGAPNLATAQPLVLRNAFVAAAPAPRDDGGLVSALLWGVAGMEVQVRQRGGSVVLGADQPDPWGRTLDASYLRPLQQWITANAGAAGTFTLVVDPGKKPDRAVYEALERTLSPYRGMLFRRDAGREVRAAVRVVVPDSAALRRHLTSGAGRSASYLFVQAKQASLAGAAPGLPRAAVAVIGVHLPGLAAATTDRAVLERQVRAIHERGYRVRLSGIDPAAAGPDRLWATLLDAGVDLIEISAVEPLGTKILGGSPTDG